MVVIVDAKTGIVLATSSQEPSYEELRKIAQEAKASQD